MLFLFSAFILATVSQLCQCVTHNPSDISVGFALKYGYGTAAALYPNGTYVELAKVPSTHAYQETILKLSYWSAAHVAPPYYTPQERWSDYGRQLKRRARKALGKPASEDVAVLSTLIKALKEESEKVLGEEIVSAAACVHRIPALYDEDLYDAFEYAGLEYLQIMSATYHHTLLTYESSAALAGHGLSICPNVTDPRACRVEDLGGTYFIVDYTNSSLFAYHTRAASAYYVIDTVASSYLQGSGMILEYPSEKWYWEEVQRLLYQALMEHPSALPEKIILVGEKKSLENRKFRIILNDVLARAFKDEIPEIVEDDPEWIQAKGVADFVRRRPYRPTPTKPEALMMEGVRPEGQRRHQHVLSTDRMEL